jgi:carbonic anhydrase
MDPRVVPEQFLGPNPLVAVFRNAGGHASPDVVRTILTLRSLVYKASSVKVMVVHHTGTSSFRFLFGGRGEGSRGWFADLLTWVDRLWNDAFDG